MITKYSRFDMVLAEIPVWACNNPTAAAANAATTQPWRYRKVVLPLLAAAVGIALFPIQFDSAQTDWPSEPRELTILTNTTDPLDIYRKGIKYPGNGMDLRQKPIHIIVSHCKAPLDWLSEFTGGYNITSLHVMSKCGEPVKGAPMMAEISRLPNVGRCDHSYAKYIATLLGRIATGNDGIVFFLKDDMSKSNLHQIGEWNSFESMLKTASSSNGFSCGVVSNKNHRLHRSRETVYYSPYHESEKVFKFSVGTYTHNKDKYEDDGVEFQSAFNNLGQFYNQVLRADTLPELVSVCYGGVFAASVSNIKMVDISVWKAAESALGRGNSIEEGHFMERIWASLLASPLKSFQIAALHQYADRRCRSNRFMPGMLCFKSARQLSLLLAGRKP